MTLTNTISYVREARLNILCFHLIREFQKQAKLIWDVEVRKIVMRGVGNDWRGQWGFCGFNNVLFLVLGAGYKGLFNFRKSIVIYL